MEKIKKRGKKRLRGKTDGRLTTLRRRGNSGSLFSKERGILIVFV